LRFAGNELNCEKAIYGGNLCWILFYFLSFKTEGIRLQQILCGLCYMPYSLYSVLAIVFDFWSSDSRLNIGAAVVVTALAVFGWTHNVYYTVMLGTTDFRRVKIEGPFKVGVRWIRTSKLDTEIAVYYPIDQDEHDKHIETRNAPWLHKPQEQTREKGRVYAWLSNLPNLSPSMFKHFENLKMEAVLDGKLSNAFTSGKKSLRPFIFSHGVTANSVTCSVLFRDLASKGYIIFVPNH